MKARIESRCVTVELEVRDDPEADVEERDIWTLADMLFGAVVAVGFSPEVVDKIITRGS